jgi:Arc/MetJ-type ribon-helix-helix transcriptional regulator
VWFHRKVEHHCPPQELNDDAVGWLAVGIGLEHGPEDRCPEVDELGDALLVFADAETIQRLTPAAVDTLWNAELEGMIRDGLTALTARGGWEVGPEAVVRELDERGKESAIGHAVVQQLAQGVAREGVDPFFCLDCLEEVVARAEPAERRQRACEAAALGARDVAIDLDELREAMRAPSGAYLARKLATDERREAVRARLRSIVRLGEASMPELVRELRLLLDEPMPEDAADDVLWVALCGSLVQRLEPALTEVSQIVIHSDVVKEKAISVRLDAEAMRALEKLMRDGRSRSQAIRDALMIATDRERWERARKEWAEMMADPAEQALIKEIQRDFFGKG